MTRRLAVLLTLVAALCLGLAADAGARRLHPQPAIHKSSAPAPVVKSVSPLKAKVGDKLTIVGKNFRSKSKTKVFFMRKGGGVTTAKPSSATKTKLVVRIPGTVTPLLHATGSTRFQIRILTSQFGDPTKMSKSPLIAPKPSEGGGGGDPGYGAGDCDHDGIKNRDETDNDNDLIPDTVELGTTHTDECNADTDGDGVSDGYEWQSAKDMNNTTPFNTPDAALPYPGKRPWPNALDPSDKQIDHDGDGLTMYDEYQLFKAYGHNTLPLNYSDGLQASRNVAAPTAATLAYMDMNGDGVLSDDERDVDNDNLGNWDEKYGRMTMKWWENTYNGQGGRPKESPYPDSFGSTLPWNETSMTDPDTDGDGINDGADDQDYDGLSNSFEIQRPALWQITYVSIAHDGVPDAGAQQIIDDYNAIPPRFTVVAPNPWARVQPYNPCKPVFSKTCHLHPPFGYYPDDEDWQGVDPRPYKAPPAAPWLYAGES